jgi:hypothetical protein
MPDKLEQAVADITRDDLVGSGPKTEFLQFRVSKLEKESLRRTADGLGMQVSEYVMTLHRLVEKKLSEE